MSPRLKEIPYRIIWRWVPSPQSTRKVSPSRTTAIEDTLRSTVGRDAAVPKKRNESDIYEIYGYRKAFPCLDFGTWAWLLLDVSGPGLKGARPCGILVWKKVSAAH